MSDQLSDIQGIEDIRTAVDSGHVHLVGDDDLLLLNAIFDADEDCTPSSQIVADAVTARGLDPSTAPRICHEHLLPLISPDGCQVCLRDLGYDVETCGYFPIPDSVN